MKIDVQIKFDPFMDERYQKYALFDAERKFSEKLYEALKPYIKREIDQEHVRLTLDGIESEDLGFENYQMEYHKTLKFVEPNGQRND